MFYPVSRRETTYSNAPLKEFNGGSVYGDVGKSTVVAQQRIMWYLGSSESRNSEGLHGKQFVT